MLEFEFPKIEDRKWVQPILTASGGMGSEYAFGTLYLWADTYFSKVSRYQDFLLRCSGGHYHTYNIPVGGKDLKSAVEALVQDAKEKGNPFRMWGLTRENVEQFQQIWPDRFHYELDRDGSDYIYNSSDLINLSGRKYHGKRNHLSKFNKTYDWSYEDITQENLEDCRVVAREWCKENGCGRENGTDNETCALNKAFRHFEELGLAGGLIRIDGKPAAFTIGEEINPKVYLLHFEKAVGNYDGLYAAINHEFASRRLSGYEYINREEDLGLEGLRKAKLSYYPAILLEKYKVTLREETEGQPL